MRRNFNDEARTSRIYSWAFTYDRLRTKRLCVESERFTERRLATGPERRRSTDGPTARPLGTMKPDGRAFERTNWEKKVVELFSSAWATGKRRQWPKKQRAIALLADDDDDAGDRKSQSNIRPSPTNNRLKAETRTKCALLISSAHHQLKE